MLFGICFGKQGNVERTANRGVSAVHGNGIVRETDRWSMRSFDVEVTILPGKHIYRAFQNVLRDYKHL